MYPVPLPNRRLINLTHLVLTMPFDDVRPGTVTDGHTPTVTPGATDEKLGSGYDRRDMVRMGKRQELRRNFQFFSIWGYAVILGCTWEWGLASGVFSLTNGGTAGATWMFLAVCFGMTFVMLSMAEMASSKFTLHWNNGIRSLDSCADLGRPIPLGQ